MLSLTLLEAVAEIEGGIKMMNIIKKLIPIALIASVLVMGINLINALNNEVVFHLDHILYFNPVIVDPGLELSKNNVDKNGNMKLMGTIAFEVKLDKEQFNNFWAEQTDLDLANNVVIVEMESSLNSFEGSMKFDKNKEYYDGDHYFDFQDKFTSVINFSLTDIYLKLPKEAFLEDGKIDPKYKYDMFFTFKSVLYNSDNKNPEPFYTKNFVKISFNIVEINERLIVQQTGEREVINQKTPLTSSILDKIKNKFKDFWGE